MKLSTIEKLITGELSPADFRMETAKELFQYENLVKKVGSVIPIYCEEDIEFEVSINEVRKLCEFFLNDQLNARELAYIADALQLSENTILKGETIADLVAELTDSEINGPFTKARAREILGD